MTKLAVAVAFLTLNFYTYHFLATDEVYPDRSEFSEFPLEIGPWGCSEREVVEAGIVKKLDVTDYLVCNYRRPEPMEFVGVYVGYHESQVRTKGGAESTAIHPPRHCLPGSGWDIIASEVAPVLLGRPAEDGQPAAEPIRVNRLTIARGETRALVYYWYQSRGRVIAEDWKKIVYQFWDRATLHRTDGSLVRFTIPVIRGNFERADSAFLDLAQRMFPLLPEYLPD